MILKLSAKGHIVIPAEVRKQQGLKTGDQLVLENEPGQMVLRKKKRMEGLAEHLKAFPVKGFKLPKVSGTIRAPKF